MGVARIFQKGGGGEDHTDSYRGYSPDSHLNIVGCLLTKGVGGGESHAPQDPPQLRPCNCIVRYEVASTISLVVSRGHLAIH